MKSEFRTYAPLGDGLEEKKLQHFFLSDIRTTQIQNFINFYLGFFD